MGIFSALHGEEIREVFMYLLCKESSTERVMFLLEE